MKKVVFIMLFIPFITFSQKYELGKVTKEELAETKHQKDTSASAAVLFHKGKSHFDFIEGSKFILRTDVTLKLKIYAKDGLSLANREIQYYIGNNSKESVRLDKCYTYNLVDGKIEKTKLTKEGIFEEKINDNWETVKITMPNVKVGSIIEIEYTLESPFFENLYDWRFQSVIPVNYSEYTTIIPEYFTYNFYTRGNLGLKTEKNTSTANLEIFENGLTNRSSRLTYDKQSTRITFSQNVTQISVNDVPAFKREAFMNDIDNFLSNIQYQLASTKFPNSNTTTSFSSTWESVVKNIYESENFGLELDRQDVFNDDIEKLVGKGSLSEREKIEKIFDFVKNNYNWNGKYSIYCKKGLKNTYKEKTGNVAEINFILIAMLQNIGINASPILLTTRDRAISLYPSNTAFNYVICGVETTSGILVLDATSKYADIDVLPNRALNYFGRIVRKNQTSELVDLSPKKHAKKTIGIIANINDNAQITGKIRESMLFNQALNFRVSNNDLSTDSYLEKIEKNYPGFEIEDYNLVNKLEIREPLQENYSFTDKSSSEIINEKIYFKPFIIFAINENPFKLAERTYPIDFIFPINDNFVFSYTIPEGYEAEFLPADLNIETIDNLGRFIFKTKVLSNQIQISSNLYINASLIAPDKYLSVKSFYNEVFLKMNEQIVLKKK
jgi:hypothetical protein